VSPGLEHRQRGFVERTLASLLETMEHTLLAERVAERTGMLQVRDARVKVIALLVLVIAVSVSHDLRVIAVTFALALTLGWASKIRLVELMKHAWWGTLVFSAAIVAPAIVMTPGRTILRLQFGTITEQGLRAAGYLLARVGTVITLCSVLVLTTSWARILRALRALRVPVVFVVILGMTYRYIFVLLQTAHDIFESRRSRRVGPSSASQNRWAAVAAAGVLMSKTLELSGEIYLAMQSRGFRGEVYLLDDPPMRGPDWLTLAGVAGVAVGIVWISQ